MKRYLITDFKKRVIDLENPIDKSKIKKVFDSEEVGNSSVFTDTKNGLVPFPGSGTLNSYLKSDGTWQTINDSDTTYSNGEGLNLTGTTFSVKYGVTAGTAVQGDDSRVNNGQTAFDWGDHSLADYETAFTKNSAFNKNFGTAVGTVAQGNDSRINNGQTAFSWGDHALAGYEIAFSKNSAFNKNFGTASGTVAQGNDSRINNGQTAYEKRISGISITGTSTKTITITLADATTITGSFTDVSSTGSTSDGNDYVTGGNFNTATGAVTLTRVDGGTVSFNLDGRYEVAFTKNSAFNKNFGTAAGTVAQGNDSRINNGQTAFSWGDHADAGYLPGLFVQADTGDTVSSGTITPGQRLWISAGKGLASSKYSYTGGNHFVTLKRDTGSEVDTLSSNGHTLSDTLYSFHKWRNYSGDNTTLTINITGGNFKIHDEIEGSNESSTPMTIANSGGTAIIPNGFTNQIEPGGVFGIKFLTDTKYILFGTLIPI